MEYIKRWETSEKYPNYDISNECQIWDREKQKYVNTCINANGIHTVNIKDNTGKRCNVKVDTLVAEAFYKGDHTGFKVKHKDGNRYNNPDNLQWVPKKTINESKSNSTKKVRCVETGEIFDSIYVCSEKMNIKITSISKCLKCPAISTYDGYHFEWT